MALTRRGALPPHDTAQVAGPLVIHDERVLRAVGEGFLRYQALDAEDREWLLRLGGNLDRLGYSLQWWHVGHDYGVLVVYRGDGTQVGLRGTMDDLRLWLDKLPNIAGDL